MGRGRWVKGVGFSGRKVKHAKMNSANVISQSGKQILRDMRLTSVRVALAAVAILQPRSPRALVACTGSGGLAHSIASLEALCPLSAVQPASLGLHAQPVTLALEPLALVGVT